MSGAEAGVTVNTSFKSETAIAGSKFIATISEHTGEVELKAFDGAAWQLVCSNNLSAISCKNEPNRFGQEFMLKKKTLSFWLFTITEEGGKDLIAVISGKCSTI